jgi:hypothetical protein
VKTPQIKVTFTQEEAQAAVALWEVGLKSLGDSAVETYTVLRDKLRAAAQKK